MTNAFNIIDASPEDAPLIAWAIMEAVGEELVDHLAGNKTRKDVEEIFTRLAGRTDSQYSYLNTRIAIVPDGTKAAICVSYDGGKLKELRRSFFAEANRVLGWGMTPEDVDALPGETCGEEFYLDSLSTLPHYRGQGAARILIEDAARKATAAGLPLGLLVADHNPGARQLYESIGFRPVARRPFAGEIMTNLRLPQ